MTARLVAVFDIGKTNVKLVVHDLASGIDVFERRRANRVLPGPPYPHFDVDGLWAFLLGALREAALETAIDAICVTTHGASIVVMGEDGLAAPILDYEHPLTETAAAYARIRPPFAETLSPPLPNGLNVGAQLHWLQEVHPDLWSRVRTIVTYPGYWGYRLTGRLSCDVTSLGPHTDVWNPAAGRPSSLAVGRGWADLFAPVGLPFDRLGGLVDDVAAATGLAAGLPVTHGIHDSNASLLPHLLTREAPFTVVSTGTWVILFAVGADPDGLDPARDTLCNVDAFGRPVPSGRIMAGREFDMLTRGTPVEPSAADVAAVLARGVMALPTFAPGTGPYGGGRGRWTHEPDSLSDGERSAAASLYVALVAWVSLEVIGAAGPILVEGPFAGNAVFCEALARLTGRSVLRTAGGTGTSTGAALLANGPAVAVVPPPVRGRDDGRPDLPGLADYARDWRALADAV